jgi:hypothetical protein
LRLAARHYMYYFAHYLAAAGIDTAARITIVRTADESWIYETLRGELLDVFPAADVSMAPLGDLPSSCDLIVLPLADAYEFPLQDVVYAQLDLLAEVAKASQRFGHVLIYRARWREVEVVSGDELPSVVRRRRLERRAIAICRQSSLLRRLLRPRYPV